MGKIKNKSPDFKNNAKNIKSGLRRKLAFTLVELIVVITILAILGTIAFISFQGYTRGARDSVRLEDMTTIGKTLELYNMKIGKYPESTNGVSITYSGAEVWSQGTFGKSTFTNIRALNKIPLDPFTKNEYTYSVSYLRTEYQIGGINEGSLSFNSSLINGANAAGNTSASALIKGNYNGKFIITKSGSVDYILATPSIIANNIKTTDLLAIIGSGNLVYNKNYNLPESYKNSGFNLNGGFTFTPLNILVFTGSIVKDLKSGGKVASLSNNLKYAYSGSNIIDNGNNSLDIMSVWNILKKVVGMSKLLAETSCNNIRGTKSDKGDGFYTIFTKDKLDIFQTYCNMTNTDGWTFLFSVNPSGTTWAFNSVQWTTPNITSQLDSKNIFTNEVTSDAYTKFIGNEIKICRGNLTKCYIIKHNKNRTLWSYYTSGQSYTQFSRCNTNNDVLGNCSNNALPNNVGIDTRSKYFNSLLNNGTVAYDRKYGVGININYNNKLGYQGDEENIWPDFDNSAFGIGSWRSYNCGFNGQFYDVTRARSVSRQNRCVYQTPDDQYWYVFSK